LKLIRKEGFDTTPVPDLFIQKYMTCATPVFSIIYIYTLNKCIRGEKTDIKEIAEVFDILESDVLKAWKYWNECGIVKFDEENDSIEFLEFNYSDDEKKAECSNYIKNDNFEKSIMVSTKPVYTPQELEMCQEQSDEAKRLFSMAEKVLGRLLNFNDIEMIYSFYDWLGMSVELIEVLLKYCVENNGARKNKFIESVAIKWCESGIDTVEKAMERINNKQEYIEIMKSFGIKSELVEKQKEYMDRWLSQYKMPLPLIKEACERTVLKTGKSEFGYAEKIISDWYKKGVKTISEVKKYDDEYKKGKNKTVNSKTYQKSNKFVNYEQGDYDFDSLNRLKRELLDK